MKKSLGRYLGILAAFLMVAGVASAVQNADVSGEWLLTMTLPNGNERVMTLNLEQDGANITGTVMAEGMEEPGEVTGTVDGNNIEWSVTRETQRGDFTMVYKGVVDGDTMSGTMSVMDREMEWTAKKK